MAENETSTRPGSTSAKGLAALGLSIVALSGFWLYASPGLVMSGVRTSGVVTGLAAIVDADGRTRGFAPVVRYSDESGKSFIHRSQVADNPAAYAPGDYVQMYYDPADPKNAVIRGFRETFAVPLLIAILGSFFLLLAGIASKSPPRRVSRSPDERASPPLHRAPPDQATRLQFHPFNAVAYKHYLGELKGSGARKVKITDAAAALVEGRNPVALCEFLAAMAVICAAEDAEAYVAEHCPHLVRPQFFRARNTQGMAFLFEDTACIVLCPIDLDNLWHRIAIATAPRTGRHDLVPGDVIWEAAPRHSVFAKEWDAVRSDIELWVKETAIKDDSARPFLFAGHATGGALANLGAYEFAKRGRVVAGVVAFGAPPPGGQVFADEYNQLGLDERTVRLQFDVPAPALTLLPLLYVSVGRVWRLDQPALAGREPLTSVPAQPATRTAYSINSLQRRYGLALSILIYQRLRELSATNGSAEDYDAAYTALGDHLAYVRGQGPDQTGGVFAAVSGLPVKVIDAADLESLKTVFPNHLI